MYQQHGTPLEAEHRPLAYDFWRCTSVERYADNFTDAVIDEICTRWQASRVLKDLYLDPAVFAEFEAFRQKFIAASDAWETFHIVSPGFEPVYLRERHSERPGLVCGRNFGSIFHQTLCLHSLGIAMRTVARATTASKPERMKMRERALCAWSKTYLDIWGQASELTPELQTQCLETWDFIYHFLLRKLFPPNILEEWLTACSDDIYLRNEFAELNPVPYWCLFMDRLRWGLYPHKVTEAVAARTWEENSTFIIDEHVFMIMRESFDDLENIGVDWEFSFKKASCIPHLQLGGGSYLCEDKEHFWWDSCRIRFGSPFHSDFDWGAFFDILVNEDPGEAESIPDLIEDRCFF